VRTDVRPARPGELDQVVALDAEARAALVDQRGGPAWLEEHPPLAELPSSHLLVATIDDVVVGFLRLELTDGGVARVERVYVTPEARGIGFGDDLLEHALRLARERGAVAVEGEALPGDRETKNLYERAGITARKITVFRRLDE
jgi:GNAT superfamily N-acetyltransferase